MNTSYLLDTNAISEAVKSRKDIGYMSWLNATDDTAMYISCLTLGEIQKGIVLAKDAQLRQYLDAYLKGLHEAFSDRILTIDTDTCILWGKLITKAQQSGRTAPVLDSLIAAQCLKHGMILVTRNVKDFQQFSDLEILCPWAD